MDDPGRALTDAAIADAILIGGWLTWRAAGRFVRWFVLLAIDKGLSEPLAAWAFRRGWIAADRLSGDRLPGLPHVLGGDQSPPPPPTP
jgi:hypothetical protein